MSIQFSKPDSKYTGPERTHKQFTQNQGRYRTDTFNLKFNVYLLFIIILFYLILFLSGN